MSPQLPRSSGGARAGPAPLGLGLAVALLLNASASAQPAQDHQADSDARLRAGAEAARLQTREALRRFRREDPADPGVAECERRLAETLVRFDDEQANLYDLLENIRNNLRLSTEVGPEAKAEGLATQSMPIPTASVPAGELLDSFLDRLGLSYWYQDQLLYIGRLPPNAVDHPWTWTTTSDLMSGSRWRMPIATAATETPEADRAVRGRLGACKLSLRFTDEPLVAAIIHISTRAGVPIMLHPAVAHRLHRARVTSWCEDDPADQILSRIVGWHQLEFRVLGGMLVVLDESVAGAEMGDPDEPDLPSAAALTALGRNAQGRDEYRHERTGMVFVSVPAGEFEFGSTADEFGASKFATRRPVRIDRPFLLGKTEVTNAQFRKFSALRRYRRAHACGSIQGVTLDRDEQPVVRVSWAEILGFCRWAGVRPPTEEEWEWAVRGSNPALFPWGTAWPPPDGAGNFADRSLTDAKWFPGSIEGFVDGHAFTAPVGSFPANALGIHDLAGNVWELCLNRSPSRMDSRSVRDEATGIVRREEVATPGTLLGPEWLDPVEEFSRLEPTWRGGAWCEHHPASLRIASRAGSGDWDPGRGFRVALDYPAPK